MEHQKLTSLQSMKVRPSHLYPLCDQWPGPLFRCLSLSFGMTKGFCRREESWTAHVSNNQNWKNGYNKERRGKTRKNKLEGLWINSLTLWSFYTSLPGSFAVDMNGVISLECSVTSSSYQFEYQLPVHLVFSSSTYLSLPVDLYIPRFTFEPNCMHVCFSLFFWTIQ